MRRKHPIPEEICSRFHRRNLAFVFVQLQSEMLRQVCLYLRFDLMQARLVVVQHDKIVNVADIVPALQRFFHEMIEAVEVDVGIKLACQIANRNTPSPIAAKDIPITDIPITVARGPVPRDAKGFRTTVARGPVPRDAALIKKTLLRITKIHNQIHQPQHVCIPNLPAEQRFKDTVVDRWKILLDVAFENIVTLATERCKPIDRFMRAFVPSASIRIEDKRPIENRFNDVAERVMHDPVAIRRGTDFPQLRLVNVEFMIRAGAIGARLQLLLQAIEFSFQMEIETGDFLLESFAILCFPCGEEQIFKRAYLVEKTVIGFHVSMWRGTGPRPTFRRGIFSIPCEF